MGRSVQDLQCEHRDADIAVRVVLGFEERFVVLLEDLFDHLFSFFLFFFKDLHLLLAQTCDLGGLLIVLFS